MKATTKLFIFLVLFISVIIAFPTSVFAVDITNPWSATTSIRAGAGLVSFSASDKVYVVGGSAATGNSYSEIISNTPGSNGQLDLWTSEGNFPTALIFHSITRRGNDIYVLGGREENSGSINDFVNKVFLGKIDSLGNVGSWVQQTSFPVKSALGAAAIVGDRIYYAGGFNPGYSNKIYSALISSDGTLGAWIDAGNLPTAQIGFSMIEYNGHLIIIGGDNSSAVYKTTPDATGHISGWDATESLLSNVYRGSVIKTGTTLLVIGGQSSVSTDNVYFTTLNADGTVGPWTLSSNHLPSPVHGGSAALVGQYLYLMGGYEYPPGSYLNSVYFTKLNLNPSDTSLNVPLLKQTNPSWGNLLYDTANLWAPLGKRSISDWGCALTSAVMIFQYHGITKMPDGSNLNPGTLNTWMKSQIDGYVNNGWVNWLALTRLSKLSKPKNPAFTFDALEYRRIGGYSPLKLTQDLQNNIPGILEEPGHFIVGKGTVGNTTFAINDPYYARTLLSDYSNSFLSLGEFIPSHTDLSYMMFVVDDGVTLTVKNVNGTVQGDAFTQAPLDQDGGAAKSGNPKNFYYVPAPTDGSYALDATSFMTKKYKLQSYFYNKDGNVKTGSNSGIVSGNSADSYVILFNRLNQNTSNLKHKISFNKLLSDLDLLLDQKLISTPFYKIIRAEILAAKALSVNGKGAAAKKALLAVSIELDVARGKAITEDGYQILKPEVVALRESL